MTAEEILNIHVDVFNRALKEQDYAALEGLPLQRPRIVRLFILWLLDRASRSTSSITTKED
jgi:hypothetical protein